MNKHSYLVIYPLNQTASYHQAIKAAQKRASADKGAVYKRDPFRASEDCELPTWACVFKSDVFVPYILVP